jgi:uncharacterized protein
MPKRTLKRGILLALAFGICHLTFVAAASAQPSPPALTDTVNDFAGIIDPASRELLDKRIRALKAATGDVVVVATVPTFQPYGSIDEYAVKMFENGGRGIGDKGKDNGLLIVVAKDDRKVRIEVGYDLEQFIPDGFAGQTIREAIGPAFRAGRYGPGLVDATTRIINRVAEKRNVAIPDVPVSRATQASRSRGHFPYGLLFWAVALVFIIARSARRGRRRYWGYGPWSNWTGGVGPFGGGGFGGSGGSFGGGGGGFGGGGFSGFGGGGSGGGGSSGSW